MTDTGIEHVGKCMVNLGKLRTILSKYMVLQSSQTSIHCTHKSDEDDLKKILKKVKEVSNVFSTNRGRQHSHFPKFEANILSTIDTKKLKLWMSEQYQKLVTCQIFSQHVNNNHIVN